MNQRSTSFLGKKIRIFFKVTGYGLVFLTTGVFVFNIFLGLFKQIIGRQRLSSMHEKKKEELLKLKEENKKLRLKLQETEDPDFFNYESARLFGLSKDGSEPKFSKTTEKEAVFQVMTPNWKKWLDLFGI